MEFTVIWLITFFIISGVAWLWMYFPDRRNRKKLLKLEKEATPKLPHEIFPKLVHWRVGDIIKDSNYLPEKFLGVPNGKVHGRTFIYSPSELEKLGNESADKRFNKLKKAEILAEIEQDDYNQFLQIKAEEHTKLLG